MRDRNEFLKKKIEGYLKKKQLFKSDEYKKLEKSFLTKARKNFTVANLLFNISEKEDIRKLLNLASDFEMYDWVIIVSYYAMYTSSLSALARLGYKSKSHAATITILEYNFVRDKKLETEDIHKLVKAYNLSEQLITKLIQTKTKRETAQYDATPSITREMAKTSLDDADDFIIRIEENTGKS
ncbi:MAG: HEPN domain-containing protein [Nanoarchaeota archaeon]|nr:HEPN domain-containing protein [Nanoarchaeota archaeon]MBU0962283.1 HEPN domain-containing protein [Nanoarchaeota archaeon]